jgi:hypothetical protein
MCRTTDENGQEIRRWITAYKKFWLLFRSYTILLILNYISQPATFWRRDISEQVGYFDETLEYTLEYDYWLRIGKNNKLHFVNELLANFLVYPNSKSGSTANAQFEEQLLVAQRYLKAPFLRYLHEMHNAIIVGVYSRIFGLKRTS